MKYHKSAIAIKFRRLTIWKIIGIVCLTLSTCNTPVKTETVTLLPTDTDNPVMESPRIAYYGVVYPYPENGWNESDRLTIRERLVYLRSLGINTVVQVFSSEMIAAGTQQNWLIFLDEAQQVGVQVVAYLYPSNEGRGKEFNYHDIDEFLSVVRDHPALLAYLGLHEPLEQFDSEQLRGFYRHIKNVAPGLLVAHYMDDMAWFDDSPRFPGRYFTAEICDICVIWYYPAIFINEDAVLDMEHVQEMVSANRALVNERSPDSELWFLGQAHSQQENMVRMPTPEEMETIFKVATQEGVDGFLWYAWLHDQYEQVLSDPGMEPQRGAIRMIYETHIGSMQVK
jgi:hypothetical protein